MTHNFDAIIVGAGQAGPGLAGRLANAGMTVAFVERKLFGGTCVNTGCTPTKTLVASAYAAYLARRASDYGVSLGGAVTVDMNKVKVRQDAVVRDSREGLEAWLASLRHCTIYRGHARLESATQVRVGDEVLTAKWIFINVGGRANVPALQGLDQVTYLTNSTLLELQTLPRHLVVIGGSYVGLEFAQIYRRFGSEVTVVEMADRLIKREDPEVSAAVQEILAAEGIQIRVGAECVRLEASGQDVRVHVICRDGEPEILGSHVLLAVGRRPNTDDLGLEAAGVKTDKQRLYRCRRRTAHERARASGRWATATARVRSLIPPTTTLRSSQPTCSMKALVGSATGYRLRSLHRSAPWPGRADRSRSEGRRQAPACRVPTDDAGPTSGRERRNKRLHEDRSRR